MQEVKRGGQNRVPLVAFLALMVLAGCVARAQAQPLSQAPLSPAAGYAGSDRGQLGLPPLGAATVHRALWPLASSQVVSLQQQPTGVTATVQVESATIPQGQTQRVPIWVKNLTDPGGLGGFDLRVLFDPAVVNILIVEVGAPPFAANPYLEEDPAVIVPIQKVDNSKGQALFNHIQVAIPGPTGDILVAYLTVKAVGPSGSSTPLDISVTSLIEARNGDDIPAVDQDGAVTIQ